MGDVNSLNHSGWERKYRIVFIPKHRKRVLSGQIRKEMVGFSLPQASLFG